MARTKKSISTALAGMALQVRVAADRPTVAERIEVLCRRYNRAQVISAALDVVAYDAAVFEPATIVSHFVLSLYNTMARADADNFISLAATFPVNATIYAIYDEDHAAFLEYFGRQDS